MGRQLHMLVLKRQIEIRLTDRHPTTDDITSYVGIESGGPQFEVHTLSGMSRLQSFRQRPRQGFKLILAKNWLGRIFFRKPAKGHALLGTKGESLKNVDQLSPPELSGMRVGRRIKLLLERDDHSPVFMHHFGGIGQSCAA